jgi:hypothetical protein
MIKKAILFIAIAAVHFALCVAVVSFGNVISPSQPGQYLGFFQALAFLARILYFPLLSLGLYSRQYFPGNLIYLVVVFNSILWALGIFLLIGGYRKIRRPR